MEGSDLVAAVTCARPFDWEGQPGGEQAETAAYLLAPEHVARITRSRVLIVNGADLEEWLRPVLENAGGARLVIEASKGLTPRQPKEGESTGAEDHEIDPHFWLDPILVIHYVENIRDGLSQSDPDGQSTYVRNAQAYITQLHELNAWISTQVDQIQPERRSLLL